MNVKLERSWSLWFINLSNHHQVLFHYQPWIITTTTIAHSDNDTCHTLHSGSDTLYTVIMTHVTHCTVEVTHCTQWKWHMSHCTQWKWHIVHSETDTLYTVKLTHCTRWNWHIVHSGTDTLYTVKLTHCVDGYASRTVWATLSVHGDTWHTVHHCKGDTHSVSL